MCSNQIHLYCNRSWWFWYKPLHRIYEHEWCNTEYEFQKNAKWKKWAFHETSRRTYLKDNMCIFNLSLIVLLKVYKTQIKQLRKITFEKNALTCPFLVVSCRRMVSGCVFPTVGSPLWQHRKEREGWKP